MSAYRLTWIKRLLLLAIIGIAIFFRLYQIESLPPGDSYDPAFYGVDALLILEGDCPIFFEGNFGREPLFSYLLALFFLIFGPTTQAIHIASAFVGILTVPLVYLVAEELLHEDEGLLKRWGALVAALMVALSYWHLNWSRFGVRAVLVPLFAALTFYFLWRGLRTGSHRDFVTCGIALGFSLYTYQAARLLPILVVLGFAYTIWERHAISKEDWTHFLIVVGVSCLVFAPLGYYFVTHPGSFSERIDQVLTIDLRYIFRALSFLSFGGDTKPLVTIPGRPALNPFFSILLLLGIVVSVIRLKNPRYVFLLTWLGSMLALAALAGKETASKRAVGAIPAVAVLIAIGALVSWQQLRQWLSKYRPGMQSFGNTVWGLCLAIGFVFSGWLTYRDYFIVWPSDPDLFTHFQAGVSAIGRYLKTLPEDEEIYVSPEYLGSPSMLFNSGLREGVKSYNGRVCMVVPEQTDADTTYVVVPNDDKEGLGLLQSYFPQGEIVAEGPLHYNLPYFLAYRVPKGAHSLLVPSKRVEANWENTIGLLGYDVDAEGYAPGDTIELTLYYQARQGMDVDYTAFTHLMGPENSSTGTFLWAQDDSEPCRRFYTTSTWALGEVVRDKYFLEIPQNAPDGEYELQVGFYVWPSLERLRLSVASGELLDVPFTLGTVKIATP